MKKLILAALAASALAMVTTSANAARFWDPADGDGSIEARPAPQYSHPKAYFDLYNTDGWDGHHSIGNVMGYYLTKLNIGAFKPEIMIQLEEGEYLQMMQRTNGRPDWNKKYITVHGPFKISYGQLTANHGSNWTTPFNFIQVGTSIFEPFNGSNVVAYGGRNFVNGMTGSKYGDRRNLWAQDLKGTHGNFETRHGDTALPSSFKVGTGKVLYLYTGLNQTGERTALQAGTGYRNADWLDNKFRSWSIIDPKDTTNLQATLPRTSVYLGDNTGDASPAVGGYTNTGKFFKVTPEQLARLRLNAPEGMWAHTDDTLAGAWAPANGPIDQATITQTRPRTFQLYNMAMGYDMVNTCVVTTVGIPDVPAAACDSELTPGGKLTNGQTERGWKVTKAGGHVRNEVRTETRTIANPAYNPVDVAVLVKTPGAYGTGYLSNNRSLYTYPVGTTTDTNMWTKVTEAQMATFQAPRGSWAEHWAPTHTEWSPATAPFTVRDITQTRTKTVRVWDMAMGYDTVNTCQVTVNGAVDATPKTCDSQLTPGTKLTNGQVERGWVVTKAGKAGTPQVTTETRTIANPDYVEVRLNRISAYENYIHADGRRAAPGVTSEEIWTGWSAYQFTKTPDVNNTEPAMLPATQDNVKKTWALRKESGTTYQCKVMNGVTDPVKLARASCVLPAVSTIGKTLAIVDEFATIADAPVPARITGESTIQRSGMTDNPHFLARSLKFKLATSGGGTSYESFQKWRNDHPNQHWHATIQVVIQSANGGPGTRGATLQKADLEKLVNLIYATVPGFRAKDRTGSPWSQGSDISGGYSPSVATEIYISFPPVLSGGPLSDDEKKVLLNSLGTIQLDGVKGNLGIPL